MVRAYPLHHCSCAYGMQDDKYHVVECMPRLDMDRVEQLVAQLNVDSNLCR
jgi:hypothetical protein